MDPSPTSSSTASHSISSGYDVFINHRGPDTKNTFASYLYHALLSRGLRPFLDREELEEGLEFPSQIVDVIQNASVHVAIFSPGYADSRWCLHELVLMQETTATIVPVFYNVEPAALRWTDHNKTGRYAEALNKLQRKKTVNSQTVGSKKRKRSTPRYDPAIIQKWRDALSRVADTSGFDLKGKFNGDEGLMLEKVIERVLKIMAKQTQLYVAKYPTGLDDKVKDFETTVLRQQPTGKAQVVGIVGWGGVGKTTMSKEFFNRKHSEYSRSYFLSDVRENAKISLHSLQSKLLKGLGQSDRHIDDIHQGTQMLLEFLSPGQVLLVLDDIDHQDQIDALLPNRDALHKDSLIVITTRDKDVLARSGVEEPSIYKLIGLTPQHSRELFCLYAFSHPHPLAGFEDLVKEFVNACGGLPLSLKVFGALLFGKEKYYWKDRLDRLHQVELPSDIQNRLKISYDPLSGDEKQIFLDIACFFIGQKRNIGIGLWNESTWKSSFQNLECKCLVEVDDDGYIRMHDHLRDLGRQIGEEELPHRLWRPTENIDDWLQQQSSVITEARGISIVHTDSCDKSIINSSMLSCNQTNRFLDVHAVKLQLLSSEGDLLERILRKVHSPNLICLSWRDCPYSYLPSWIPTRNLRVLTLEGKVLKTLWQDNSQAPNSFGNFTNLYHLDLSGCTELRTLPDSLGGLTNLHHVDLSWCTELRRLPVSFGGLTNLHHMDLWWCEKLESLPDSLGGLTNLHRMGLTGCLKLKRLPDSLGGLTNLHHMDLSECSKLERLPDSLGGLTNLHHMDLEGCQKLEKLPDCLGGLTNLHHMSLQRCEKLERLPDTLGGLANLHHMDLRGCWMLERLPDSLGGLKNLHYMDLRGCSNLERLPDSLGGLKNLHHMDLRGCSNLEWLPDSLGDLTNLHHMDLRGCCILERLPDSFGGLKNLRHMDLRGCSNLEWRPDSLCGLKNLQHMDLRGCSNLERLPDLLGGLTNLHHMDLSRCWKLERLPDSFGSLTNLKHLDLSGCSDLTISSDTLGNIRTLEHINLSGCEKTKVWPSKLAHQRSLKILKLTGTNLKELPSAIGVLSNLAVLCVGGPSLDTLPPSLGESSTLRDLRVEDCMELKCLPGFCGLANLETLIIRKCEKLQELPSMKTLVSLEELYVVDCVKLKSIRDLAQLTKLWRLDVRGCLELEELEGVEHCEGLQYLYASSSRQGVVKGLRQNITIQLDDKLDHEIVSDDEFLESDYEIIESDDGNYE